MEVRARAAQRLLQFAQLPLDSAFFINSGAEANENAFKMAFKMRAGRTHIAAIEHSFHGRTAAAAAEHQQRHKNKQVDKLLNHCFHLLGLLPGLGPGWVSSKE